MTVAFTSGQRQVDRAEQLKLLRRQMAAVSGKVGVGRRGSAAATVVQPEATLAVPQWLVEVLPGGLPRGTVAVLSGARSLLLSLVAAVTAGGGNVAIIGQPDVGLLAAVEMGADLSRLVLIPHPGVDPMAVAAVLLDGMDLILLNLGGRRVPRARGRPMVARARQQGCVLLVTGGDWEGATMRLAARVGGYEITSADRGMTVPGFGRISGVRLEISGMGSRGRVHGRLRTG